MLASTTVVVVAVSVRWGLIPVAASLAAGMGAVSMLYVHRLARELGVSATHLLKAFAPAAAAILAMVAAVLAVRSSLGGANPAILFPTLVGVGAVAYLAVIAVFRDALLQDARAFARAQADRA